MFKIALQSLLARKLRLVTTALAVILGVAFTAGTLVLTDTMSNIFNNLSASVYQGTDALVRAKAVFNGPNPHGRTAAEYRRVPGPGAEPRARRRRRRGQRLRVHAADRQGRQADRQPGERRAHPGRQLGLRPGASTRSIWWPGMPRRRPTRS